MQPCLGMGLGSWLVSPPAQLRCGPGRGFQLRLHLKFQREQPSAGELTPKDAAGPEAAPDIPNPGDDPPRRSHPPGSALHTTPMVFIPAGAQGDPAARLSIPRAWDPPFPAGPARLEGAQGLFPQLLPLQNLLPLRKNLFTNLAGWGTPREREGGQRPGLLPWPRTPPAAPAGGIRP